MTVENRTAYCLPRGKLLEPVSRAITGSGRVGASAVHAGSRVRARIMCDSPAILTYRPAATPLIRVTKELALEATTRERNERAYLVSGVAEDNLIK